MGGFPLLRLLPLLLVFLLPSPLREYLSSTTSSSKASHEHAHAGELLPIVLFPGVSCSDLEARLTEEYRPSVPRCGARKGDGWFGLWENISDIPAQGYVDCFQEQMRLVYDPATNDYANLPGVETRVPNFGSPTGFHAKNPRTKPIQCLGKLRAALHGIGYRDGSTLFGAPYDMRHAPPAPGQASRVYSRYFAQLTQLVEDASARNDGAKVILFGHSMGGMVALQFVRSAPRAWRDRYVAHLFLAAPTLSQGFVPALKNLVSGPDMLRVPTATALSLRRMWWSFELALTFLPSARVFGRAPLVVTQRRNYSAHQLEELIAAVGFGDGVQAFRRRALPQMRSFRAPLVPVTCFNGVGVPTPLQLVYWDNDFDAPPQTVYGDGDGKINSVGMLAFDQDMRRHPVQRRQYKSIKFDESRHEMVVIDDSPLKRIVQEILQAQDLLVSQR